MAFATMVCCQTLGKHVAVPFEYRHLLGTGKMVPERLYVFQLFVGREFFKTRGWDRWLCHVPEYTALEVLSGSGCAGRHRIEWQPGSRPYR